MTIEACSIFKVGVSIEYQISIRTAALSLLKHSSAKWNLSSLNVENINSLFAEIPIYRITKKQHLSQVRKKYFIGLNVRKIENQFSIHVYLYNSNKTQLWLHTCGDILQKLIMNGSFVSMNISATISNDWFGIFINGTIALL